MRACALVLHQFDDRTLMGVLFPSDVDADIDACRPKTRRKANALYLDDLSSHTEFGDRQALSDRSSTEIKYKNVWVDMTDPKTRNTSFVRHGHSSNTTTCKWGMVEWSRTFGTTELQWATTQSDSEQTRKIQCWRRLYKAQRQKQETDLIKYHK